MKLYLGNNKGVRRDKRSFKTMFNDTQAEPKLMPPDRIAADVEGGK